MTRSGMKCVWMSISPGSPRPAANAGTSASEGGVTVIVPEPTPGTVITARVLHGCRDCGGGLCGAGLGVLAPGLVELGVVAATSDQFVVAADLVDAAVAHHHDPVRAHRR